MIHLSIRKGFSIFKVLYISVLIVTPMVQSQAIPWSCVNNAKGFEFNIEKISGEWFEAARVPPSEVPACVKVTLPTTLTSNNTYDMKLDYINNVNKQWKPTTENLTFPWTERSQKGIFDIQYDNGSVSIHFIFKLVITDYENLAVICYYTNYVPTASMIKIMTRQQKLNSTITNQIEAFADKYGFAEQITWVEQSNRCNAAATIFGPGIALFLAVTFFINDLCN